LLCRAIGGIGQDPGVSLRLQDAPSDARALDRGETLLDQGKNGGFGAVPVSGKRRYGKQVGGWWFVHPCNLRLRQNPRILKDLPMKRKRLRQLDPNRLQLEPRKAKPGSALLDWSHFEQRTDSGTLLVGLTLEAAQMDLDQWAWQERTGVIMPRGTRNHMVAWKSVLTKLNMSPGDLDRKKLLSALDEDLKAYESAQAAKKTSFMPSIDPKELKDGTAALHKLFAKFGDVVGIEALAAFYTVDHGGDLEDNKNLIRSVVRHPANQNVFSIGAGGAPKVARLQSATGKATGQKSLFKERKPRSPNRTAE
jgi:hypothetical protein